MKFEHLPKRFSCLGGDRLQGRFPNVAQIVAEAHWRQAPSFGLPEQRLELGTHQTSLAHSFLPPAGPQ